MEPDSVTTTRTEFLKPGTADRLVIAATRAAERSRPIEVDQPVAGNGAELPGAFQAGAINAGDLQQGAICTCHSFDACYIELSDVTHEDEQSPERGAPIMPAGTRPRAG